MEKKDLRNIALKSIDETTFYPPQGQTRLRSMIETRPDWCDLVREFGEFHLPYLLTKKQDSH